MNAFAPSLPTLAAALLCAVLVAGCGGGGGSSGDIFPGADVGPAPTAVAGPAAFLTFPNPQVLPDGSYQTLAQAYAVAYYAAVDPANQKDTLAKFKAFHGFGSGTGQERDVTFGDVHDLGYGRHLTMRRYTDGAGNLVVVAMVDNYLVQTGGGYGYTSFNRDAAVSRDTQWLIGTNAIEYSVGPNGEPSFAKFFTFAPDTGARRLLADLDGNGDKAMPSICISCHGGRGDALMQAATGGPVFNLVQYSNSQARGDTQAHMMPLQVGTFDFSSQPGFTRAEQEAALKTMNQWVLCTYPLGAPSGAPEDACRRAAVAGEWQGTFAELLKSAYGGDGMPNAAYLDTYVPAGWATVGQSSLYLNTVAPFCRTCHMARGTGAMSDIDFDSYAKFQGYADRIYDLVLNHGNMPLVELVFNRFWTSGTGPTTLATFLQGNGYTAFDGTGAVIKPGRPVADPGPDRVVPLAPATPTVLSGSDSLYATTYQWSIVSGPGGGALAGANTVSPTFTPGGLGTYVIQLVVGNGKVTSPPATQQVVVVGAMSPEPAAIRFSDIKPVFVNAGCTGCHAPGANLSVPVWWTGQDRDAGGSVVTMDDTWFYHEVRGRINFTDVDASPILRKPSGYHHGGGAAPQPGFNTSVPPGDPARANYDLFLNWILNGAPQ